MDISYHKEKHKYMNIAKDCFFNANNNNNVYNKPTNIV